MRCTSRFPTNIPSLCHRSPGTPNRQSRDLEHRLYSAAGLDRQQFEVSVDDGETTAGRRVLDRGLLLEGREWHRR